MSIVANALRCTADKQGSPGFCTERTWTKEQFDDLAARISEALANERGLPGSLKNWVGYAGARASAEKDSFFEIGGEWLYDFCWLRYSTDHQWLIDCVLAIESEWGRDPGEVVSDLDKLILSRALVRVLIFSTDYPGAMDRAAEQIRRSRLTAETDTYLIARWDNPAKQYVISWFEPRMDRPTEFLP